MIQNYSIWKVLRVFFDNPTSEGFTIRYISKKCGLAAPSVNLHLKKLIRENLEGYPLVIKAEGISYPVYKANRSSDLFRLYKKMDMLFRLEESGLVKILSEEFSPKVIILFGSASKGEDVKDSDIDIFLLAKENEADLSKYESALKRKISLHFSQDFHKLPKELKNNIANGIILNGYLRCFD